MLWTICVILLILWFLGLLTGYTVGGVIPYPAGHRRHRVSGPTYSGTKVIVEIWPLAGDGEVFGKEVFSRSRKILPNLTIPSVEKVLQPTLSPQTYREE